MLWGVGYKAKNGTGGEDEKKSPKTGRGIGC